MLVTQNSDALGNHGLIIYDFRINNETEQSFSRDSFKLQNRYHACACSSTAEKANCFYRMKGAVCGSELLNPWRVHKFWLELQSSSRLYTYISSNTHTTGFEGL